MIKQQQFYVFRLKSSRLKEYNYNITLTIEQARKNKELISLGDSELLRQIREYKDINTEKLSELFKLKKIIKFQKSSKFKKRRKYTNTNPILIWKQK